MRFTVLEKMKSSLPKSLLILQSLFTNQIKCWFLMRGENQSTRGKTSPSRVENQQSQSTYDTVQSCIQSASLRPGSHSFFFWMQRIVNEGSNWTQKKNRMFMQIKNSGKKQRHTICKFVFRGNNYFYQLIDSSVTLYLAVNFQTKTEKPLCFLITFLSR